MADRGGLSYEEMQDASGLFIPENVRYMVDSMSNYSTNTFRLESISASSAQAGRIISVNLPSSSLLDLGSFRMHMDATCSGPADPAAPLANEVYAKLPQNAAQSLIQRVEVSLNGIAAAQGLNQFNTAYNLKQLAKGSVPRFASVDRAVAGAEIDPLDPTPAAGSAGVEAESLVVQDWIGLLGEHSTRFLATDLFGQVQVRITLAPNSVLVPKVFGVAMGTGLANAAQVANAANMSYVIDNIYFSVQSISLNMAYNRMLRERLEADSYLPLNYKEYYNFSQGNIATGSQTTRYSLSSASIDKLYQTQRDSNYQTTGVVPLALPNAAVGSGAFCGNAFRFRSYNSWGAGVNQKLAGNFRQRSSYNNIQQPQFLQDIMGCLCNVSYGQDKIGMGADGTMVSSRESFNDGRFLATTIMNHPTRYGVGCKSGADSRGINSSLTYETQGQVIPPAGDPAIFPLNQNSGSAETFVLAETTAEIRVGVGKDITILF
tara:strand:+ start:617 stop:2083 length:1467 start_codon:yes stop_codon:yes gene_type:complete